MLHVRSGATITLFAMISIVEGAVAEPQLPSMEGATKQTFTVTLRGDPTPYEISEERLYVPGPAANRGTLEVATHRTTDNPKEDVDEHWTRYYMFYPDVQLRAGIDCKNQIDWGVAGIRPDKLLPDGCRIVVDSDSNAGFEYLYTFSVDVKGEPRTEGFLWSNEATREEVRVRWTFNKKDEQVADAVVDAGNGIGAIIVAVNDATDAKAATPVKNDASAGKATATTAWITCPAIVLVLAAVL